MNTRKKDPAVGRRAAAISVLDSGDNLHQFSIAGWGPPQSSCISDDGKIVSTIDRSIGESVVGVDVNTQQVIRRWLVKATGTRRMHLSPDGKVLAVTTKSTHGREVRLLQIP